MVLLRALQRPLDLLEVLKDVSYLIQEASTLLTDWWGVPGIYPLAGSLTHLAIV